ncbi:uncharacterized protein N7483_002456 [Penicillium malachiteum]|uniref:uncharacterized protein n=1 Tax=Penicillium malachiteum TaxID=1324776 RepID=UPI002548D97E|nr:uncharacterized protein N7483_002456 [Penicillium malachiteum]KAJ5737331.1 hypothetical protein N7483_002456 [Penicillium malachiteum]
MEILSSHLAIDWDQLQSHVNKVGQTVHGAKDTGKRPASREPNERPRPRPTTPELIKNGEISYSDPMSTMSARSAVLGWDPNPSSDGPQLQDEKAQVLYGDGEALIRSSPPMRDQHRPPPSAQPHSGSTEPLTVNSP